jgi:phosphoglycolate phosphatase
MATPAGPPHPPSFAEPVLGIVFDLDGTLVESQHDFARMRKTVIRLAERSGVTPGTLTVGETVPALMRRAVEAMEANGIAEGAVFRFEREVNEAIDAIEMEALPRTRAIPRAAELLRALDERGYRLGLLTRSSDHFARSALQQTDLLRYFPFLRSRSSPGPAKPNPEALRLLLSTMGVPPARAALVGDHLLDCECAIAAGVPFFAVLLSPGDSRFTEADRFRAAGATATATDLPELGRLFGVRLPASADAAPPAAAPAAPRQR